MLLISFKRNRNEHGFAEHQKSLEAYFVADAYLIQAFIGLDDTRTIDVALEVKVVAEAHLRAIATKVVELVHIDAVPVI